MGLGFGEMKNLSWRLPNLTIPAAGVASGMTQSSTSNVFASVSGSWHNNATQHWIAFHNVPACSIRAKALMNYPYRTPKVPI